MNPSGPSAMNVPEGCHLDAGAKLADDVLLSGNLVIEAGVLVEHGVVFAGGGKLPTKVHPHVRIGAGAVIGAEVELGWGAQILPGCVVLTSVPPNAIVRGNPAPIVGYTDSLDGKLPDEASPFLPESPEKDRKDVTVASLGVGETKIYYMPRVTDLRGSLTVGEFGGNFPFKPERYFFVFDVPSEELRGEHAHRTCDQFLVCVRGSCRSLLDDGATRREIILDRPDVGLFMPSMIWGTQYRYTQDAVLLVLASQPYDPADYIRTYDEFRAEIGREK